MIALLENIHVALPEMIVLATACLALLADLFFRHQYKSIAFYICLYRFDFSGMYELFIYRQF